MTISPLRDRYGLPLGTTSVAAAEVYGDALDRLLAGNIGAVEGLTEATVLDEGFALAHAALALTALLRGQGADAQTHSARAAALGGHSRRERQHIAAIAEAVTGDRAWARLLVREHLDDFPRDVLLLWYYTATLRSSGRLEWPAETLALYDHFAPDYGDDWWYLGMHSFVYHELRHFARARQLGERSLDLYPRNAIPTHSLAHVFYETNDHSAGVDFISGWIDGYDRQASYHGHLSWHLALFELALGHYTRATELYERSIDPTLSDTSNTLPDAASFLWRWRLYGLARAPLPWREVRDLASRLTAQPGMAFADAHAALAFAGAGDEAAMTRLIDGLRALDASGHPLAGPVVLPLALGIHAFAQERYDEAVRLIEPVAGEIVRIGGSHAQREVFEDTLLQAYLRAGHFEQAAALLRRRLEHRHSARDFAWLSQAQAESGDLATARESLAHAARAWPDAEGGTPELAPLRDRLIS